MAIEAVCNAVGKKVINHWDDFETCNPKAKTRLICEHLCIDYDAIKEPWRTIVWLCKIRNNVAHPKAEPIITEALISEQQRNSENFRNSPESKLEKDMTLSNAKKSVAAVGSLIDLFSEKLTPEQNFGISGDMWHHTTTKIHNSN